MTETETRDGLTYCYAAPAELSPGDMERIRQLVEAGGSVSPERVKENLERAFLVGCVLDGGEIIGCAVLKEPRPEFTARIREQTGIDLSGCLERGYSSVVPAYRGKGIASKLLAGLTARVGSRKLYSVVGEENIGGQKIARNNNTKKIAVYTSPKSGKQMGIWMPARMLDQSTS